MLSVPFKTGYMLLQYLSMFTFGTVLLDFFIALPGVLCSK